MSKIGIVTLYRDNFGSILQAYSTYSFLASQGNECDILECISRDCFLDRIVRIPVILLKCLCYRGYYSDRKRIKKASTEDTNLLSLQTRERMEMFVESVFSIVEVDTSQLEMLNNAYDFFVTGSDQVWNGDNKFRYLVFADREKRIAFAPSFGTKEIKEYYRNNVKRALNGFDILSSREESGVRIIKELTGKDAIRLADPTLLLTKQEWEQFAAKGMKKDNYILLHFLNKPNELAIKTINAYLETHSCVAYCICNQYAEYSQLLRYEFLDVDPYDYVSLINRADFVFTDSFHSTLFSLNLETKFYTFERQYLHENSQSSRVVDLLNRVGLMDRFITDDCPVDYENVIWCSDALFHEDRAKQKDYLNNALGR